MKTFLITIEIEEDCWSGMFHVGQIVKFTIQCKTQRSLDKILDYYNGSEYPSYNINKIEEIGSVPFFSNYVKKY